MTLGGDLQGERRAECPSCGAPIAFRLGSSRAAVCSFCRFAVVRSDRELTAIGRVADLVPTAPLLAVGDEGSLAGRAFVVLGRVQLDHGRGPWDEWYLRFADGEWGWLARAEGRWYVTFERPVERAPAWDEIAPGTRLKLAATGALSWVVTERGGSALLSAEGELPFPFDPHESGRYADLEAEEGAFATIDLGDGTREVKLFVGREVPARELSLSQPVLGPRPVERVSAERLTCPTCGGPVPIFVPSQTERCGCAACGALLDHTRGALVLLQQLEPPPIQPLLPLGSEGELLGAKRMVIGFMQRHVTIDGTDYAFREYLLHADEGYTWLVEDSGHWLHVAPVPTSAVTEERRQARYGNRSYRRFAKGEPVVDFVIGEFYWKVAQGDRSETVDYIDPPRLLGVERTEQEITWSEGEYVEPRAIERAFSPKSRLPDPEGVAPAQPNPYRRREPSWVLLILLLLWLVLVLRYEVRSGKELLTVALDTPASFDATTRPSTTTTLTAPFVVSRGPTTLKLELTSTIWDGYVEVDAALVSDSGALQQMEVVVDRAEDEEGSTQLRSEGHFGRVEDGTHTLRLLTTFAPAMPAWGQPGSAPVTRVRVLEADRDAGLCFASLLLIALPWIVTCVRGFAFEQRRRENESP